MKIVKNISLLATIFLIGSCCVNPETFRRLKMKHYVEVDHNAQQLVLKANVDLTGGGFFWYGYDSESHESYKEGRLEIEKGDWFTLVFDWDNRRYLTVDIEENDWGRDRTMVFMAEAYADSDTVLVVQKAKP